MIDTIQIPRKNADALEIACALVSGEVNAAREVRDRQAMRDFIERRNRENWS
jgi:hypothetical protein